MVNFVIRKDKPNKDGKFAIRLRITKNRIRKYISLNIFADSNYWSDENEVFVIIKSLKAEKQKEQNEERKNYNKLLERYKVRALDIISEFEREKIDWTLNQFEDRFINRSKQGKVSPFFIRTIKELRDTGHTGNAICYERTLHMLELYDSKFENRMFSEIDIKFVRGFDLWLQKPRESIGRRKKDGTGGTTIQRSGCSGNTRKYYMKALRAILNMAIKEKECPTSTYPFGKGGFEIAKLEEETEKRYLPSEFLQRIKDTPGETEATETARRMFLFSYYCYGISFMDMAKLSKKNIILHEGGRYIIYKRQKTKNNKKSKPIQILITEEIDKILQWFELNTLQIEPYLVPVISKKDLAGEDLYKHIRNRYKEYSDNLKILAKELKIETNLTSYVSRHTMAMTLQGKNVPREVISQILGHSDLETTNTYLDSFGSSIIDEAAKVL